MGTNTFLYRLLFNNDGWYTVINPFRSLVKKKLRELFEGLLGIFHVDLPFPEKALRVRNYSIGKYSPLEVRCRSPGC